MRIKIPGYPSYSYDTCEEIVYSSKQGKRDYPLKWRNYGGILSVKLYDDSCIGYGKEFTKFQIRMMIENEIRFNQSRMYPKGNKMLTRGKFIVGSIDRSNNVSFSKQPKEHITQAEAAKEAERLVITSPEKSFVVVEVKGVVSMTGVAWR